jgi:predicted short-subunit dehydrogenase-like oxidoreductase (DUF2520 family)
MLSISIVGIGRVGGALAIALSRAGYRIDSLIHRGDATARSVLPLLPSGVELHSLNDVPSIESDIVLISTADPDIQNVASGLRTKLSSSKIVLHTSGSLSSSVLSEIRDMDRAIGSLHPLVSISDPVKGAEKFDGIYFCVEGDERAVEAARSMAEALGGKSFSIATDKKPLYHAAAVMSAGHVTALIDVAMSMLVECGVDRETARTILLPLVSSTIENLKTQFPEQALTGSFARADHAAVERHLASLNRDTAKLALEIYSTLGMHSLELAKMKGAKAADLDKIRESISVAKRNGGC